MPQYVRAKGNIFFFTVVVAQRPSNILIDEINRLRHIYKIVKQRHPFETVARVPQARSVSERKAFGSDAIGSMPSETRQISNGMSITFISIQ